ncbi:Hypothetical protein (Fragment) [Durusdinium trenchii]|uniref:Uncharacterized protein n=1 Tax=Durusdinium trenchii TaxID=1381693 RepID=A0ABP0H6D8_9DINO
MNLNEEPDEVTAAQASQTKAGSGLQRHRRSVALGRCQDGLREDQNQPMSAAPSGAERVLRQISVEEESLFPSPFRESRDAEKPTQSGGEFAVRLCSGFPDHPSHALNTHPTLRRNHLEPLGNRKDFFNNSWCAIARRYHQAAGCPSPFVDMSRRYMGLEELPSRPATGTGFAATQAPEYLPARPAWDAELDWRGFTRNPGIFDDSRVEALSMPSNPAIAGALILCWLISLTCGLDAEFPLLWLATLLATGDGVSLQAQRNGFMSRSLDGESHSYVDPGPEPGARMEGMTFSGVHVCCSVDYFNPTFVAPQLTPKQFLIISSPSQQKIVYTELKNFKSTTGRTFALIDSGLVQPEGLALDHDRGAPGSSGRLYVADKGAKKILRFHVYVQDKGNGLQLITDNVQLCIMQNADTSWVNVDINGDVFYSDATTKTINRIPVGVVEMMAKGQYSASDLNLISEKTLETGGGATSNVAASRFVFSLYDGAMNPHVGTPAGLVSDGARLYWTNMDKGKKKGSVVQGEVSPKLPSGSDKTASFPSTMLSNASDIGYGMTKSSKYVFLSAEENGVGVVSGASRTNPSVTPQGATFDFVTGLSGPRGLCWDGDQTIFVADEESKPKPKGKRKVIRNTLQDQTPDKPDHLLDVLQEVYSFPGGRLMTGAPFAKSAVLQGAFGVAILSDQDQVWDAGAAGDMSSIINQKGRFDQLNEGAF